MEWYEHTNRCVVEYGVPRVELARLCGVSREAMSRILNGKQACSSKLRQRLERTVEMFNPKYELSVMFDYVRVRFPTLDFENIMRRVLQIEPEYFQKEDYAFYGYRTRYAFQDIFVMVGSEDDASKGTLVELKGSGCRKLEYAFEAQNRQWVDFFLTCSGLDGVFKRIDLAINDAAGILDIPEIIRKVDRGEFNSIFTKFSPMSQMHQEFYQDEGLEENPEAFEGNIYKCDSITGSTLYIGSRKSDIYFCVYQKDVEQYFKEGIPLDEAEVKNRFEIRMSNERAEKVISDMLEESGGRPEDFDFAGYAFDIVNRYFELLEPDFTKPKEEWQQDYRWRWFMGEAHHREIRLSVKPEPYTIEKTWRWLMKQVAPSLLLAHEYDKLQGTNLIQDVFACRLPDKQRKILMQCLPDMTAAIHLPEPQTGRPDLKEIKLPTVKPLTRAELEAALEEKSATREAAQLRAELQHLQELLKAYEEGHFSDQPSFL